MSEYKTIECECGKVFVTQEFMCKCPRCGKTHYNTSGGALVIGIILLLLVLIAVMLGALAWLGYAQSNKKSHWHYIGAIGLGSVAIGIGENAWRHDSSGWADVCLLLNGLAILAAIIYLVRLYKNRNVTEAAPNTEARVTESGEIALPGAANVDSTSVAESTNSSSQASQTVESPASSGNSKLVKRILVATLGAAAIGVGLWFFMRKETVDNQSIPQAMGQDQNGMLNQSEQNASLNSPVTVAEPGQIMTFNGAWFSVEYPSNFQARGSMRSSGDPNSFESATFTSPDNTVQFYVFSPQWRAEATDIAIAPGESMGSTKTDNTAEGQVKWWTITANDGSYSRSYMERINSAENTNLIFGIRYTSTSALESYRKLYESFKASLQQFADGEDASETGSTAYVMDPPSNVRSCPNTTCEVIAVCKTKNETIKIISIEGDWALIETNTGARGYLHNSQYTLNTPGKVFTATVDKLRFRETPSFSGAVIREVPVGTTFTYLNEQTNVIESAKIQGKELPGYWYRVRATDGREGWVHGCCISGL